jgi:DNA polymerase-3 subunit epsilon
MSYPGQTMSSMEFGYAHLAGDRSGYALLDVPFVVIDLETTGLSPHEDRIVEIAMGRVENGVVVDEWATLIDPGRDPGPTFLHHISHEMVLGGPSFRDMAGEILARLDGTIVVAHHAPFEEGFLRAEFARVGIRTAALPALDTLRIARAVLASPNYKLATCCEVSGIDLRDAHTALGDVRATALLLPKLLDAAPGIRFPVEPPELPRLDRLAGPRTRVTNLRKGVDGWIRSLVTKLPISMSDHDPVGAQAYLDYLAEAMSEGKITGDQTRRLGRLAGRAGMGAAQVTDLHRRFLDGMRDAALAGGSLTVDEQRQLAHVAALLDRPGYFADITPDVPEPEPAVAGPRVWVSPSVPAQSRQRISDAGYQVAGNVSRSLVAVVVAPGDESGPKAQRARELGTHVVGLRELDAFLDAASAPPERELLAAPVAPAGWYPDPTGRHVYRYWDGVWTDHVSPGGTSIQHDPLR